MQQNIEVDNALELQLLYYIHSEIIQSEEINKILWNQSIQNWDQLISQDYTVNIIGLYGIEQTVCEYLENILCHKIKLSDDAQLHKKQSMICFINHDHTYYIAFIGQEEQFTKDYFVENIDISLFRYLKDLCSQIILLPSQQILNGWKTLEKVFSSEKSSVLQEYRIQDIQGDNISCSLIELRIDQQYIQASTKFLYGQENIRAYQIKKQQNSDFLENRMLEKIFRKLWQGYKISELDFLNDYSKNIQLILQKSSENIQEWINKKRERKNLKCQKESEGDSSFIKQFRIQNISKIVYKSIWDNMPIKYQLVYSTNIKNSILQSIDCDTQKINKQQKFEEHLTTIVNKYIDILQHFYKQKKRKNSMSIETLFNQFIAQVNQNIMQQNNQQSLIEIQLFKYSSIITKDQSYAGMIEPISMYQFQIKDYFSASNAESVCLIYYFRTSKTKQTMLIFQSQDKNNFYEYKWVLSQVDKTYKTIFTYKQQKHQLLFYYDTVNSKLYAFNCNNGISYLTFNEEKNIIVFDYIETNENKFEECCYLNQFGCFMLLSKGKLFKWQQKNFELIKLQEKSIYHKLFSAGSGYYYCLANFESFYILDFNHSVIEQINFINYSIQITNKQQITLFADLSDWYLCLINQQKQITIQIKNVNTQSQIIKASKDVTNIKYSNPFLDIIKNSEDKFGSPLQLICTSQQITELIVAKDTYQIIQEYFDFLNLRITNYLVKNNSCQIQGFQVKISELVFVMVSRVALQLCTIDQSILVPLQSGLYKRNLNYINQEQTIDILEKIEQLKFGIFEMIEHFSQYTIFIVSIMGKQSCGKSYLFNRIFGTRFGVSSARCTDGIQMSLSKVENTIFITLDCEGLFSQRRTAEEEKMLLIFLVGLSDVTILNQDLTFNRNMDDVFANLATCSDNLKGDNLFLGKLIIAVRDVNQNEKEQAEQELLNNITNIRNSQQKENFLSKLFKGDFITILMSHFENKHFEYQVSEIRRSMIKFSQTKCKWTDYKQLIQTMKIMLVQLEVNDHRKIDDIIKEHNIRKIKNQAIQLWNQYQIGDIDGMNFQNFDQTFQVLQNYFIAQRSSNYQTIHHSETLKQSEQDIKQFLEQRAKIILYILQKQFKELLSENCNLVTDILQLLNNFNQSFYNCDQKCFECNLSCKQRIRHSNQQQIYYDAIQDNIQKEKLQQNKIKDKLINQQNFSEQEYSALLQQKNNYQKEISYLQLHENKFSTLKNLKQLFQKDIDESQIHDYMVSFLQSNFIQINGEKSLDICEKIISNDQLLLFEDIKQKERLLGEFNQQNQSFQQKQNQYNLQKQNYQQMQQMLIKQITDLEQQMEDTILKQQNKPSNLQKEISDNSEDSENLTISLEQKKNIQQNLIEQQVEINTQSQQLKQGIIQQIYDQGMEFLLEFELLPKLDKKLQELIVNHNSESQQLERLNKYLQKIQNNLQLNNSQQNNSQLNNSQLNNSQFQINKINQDIQKIENALLINSQSQEQIKAQINDLKQIIMQGQQSNNEDIANLIIEIEYPDLIIKKKEFEAKLQIIQDNIANLEAQLNIQYNSNKLINLEQDLQKYKEQLKTINEQQLDDIEIQLQDSIELQDKIKEINCQIQKLKEQTKKNQDNLQIFEQMKDQNKLLIDYNKELKNYLQTTLSGKKLQELENIVQQLNEQIQQIDEIKKLNQQLEESQTIQSEQEQKLIDIKNQINKSHNCGFKNHDCDQICQGCNNPDVLCKFKAGHNDQTHLCENNQHFCKVKCKIQDCQNPCQIEFGHKDSIAHNCLQYHQCHNQCNYCQESCSINASEVHQNHQCQKKYCNQECYFMKNCFGQIKCQNNCSKLHNEKHDIHICQNNHQCNYTCEQPGICQIGNYTEKNTKRETENGSFQFIIYEQNSEKKQCQYLIDRGYIQHIGLHKCDKKFHTCNQRCPECNAYCDKEFNHKGNHSVFQHRNKEKQQFTLLAENQQDKVEIQEKGQESRIYKVGESCYPETCSKSCYRRDRAHFHLIPCPAKARKGRCLQNTLKQGARHQNKLYKGSNLIYDEILCDQYWEYHKWEHPVDKKFGQLISLCNYYCQKCDYEQKQKYFCTQLAWHTSSNDYDDHLFSCQENHKFYGIDIAFVIDSTLTMSKYVEIIKKAVAKFQYASDMYKKNKNAILYSIVSYTDHDKDYKLANKQQCVKYIDFTDYQNVQLFASYITFEYSSDYCEAMLDGLNKASELNWRQKTSKFLFLIADAPPHGRKKFHNFSRINFKNDNFPDGCPCGLKEDFILNKLNELGIKLVVLKLNDDLNLTIQVFSKLMKEMIVLNNPEEMKQENFIDKMEEMICEQLRNEEITIGTDRFM